jgi:hypothetical protein
MKRVIKIIKAFRFMYPSDCKLSLPVSIILNGLFAGLFVILICSKTTRMVHNYVSTGTIIEFSDIVIGLLYLINVPYVFILRTQGITWLKGKNTGNLNNFLIQAPVLKKDIYNVKFAIVQMQSIPFFIIVVYLIGLNFFIGTSELISAYSGFLVLIYCIWTMTMSIGFSPLSSKKYKAFRHLIPVSLLVSSIFLLYLLNMPYVQPGTLVNEKNMFSALGPTFIPILKACRHIGGVSGIIIILVSTISSYFLGCKLPLRISEKVGA